MSSSSSSAYWEGIFLNIDINSIHQKLKDMDANNTYKMGLYRLQYFYLPQIDETKYLELESSPDKKVFMRLMLKMENKKNDMMDQQMKVEDFDQAKVMLKTTGFIPYHYREFNQEKWLYKNDVIITYNKYPGIEPFLQVIITKKQNVDSLLKKLELRPTQVLHQNVDKFYADIFNKSEKSIREINEITFQNIFDLIKKMSGKDMTKQQVTKQIRRRRTKTGKLLINQ